jgi:hypothetical protein
MHLFDENVHSNIKALKVFLSIIKSFRLYNNLKNHSLSGLSEGEMCLARYSSHIYTLKYKEGDGTSKCS